VEKEIVQMPMGVDNIAVDSHSNIWISGHPNLLVYQEYCQRKIPISPSEVVKLNFKGEKIEQQSIFVDNGDVISGSTTACPFGDLLLIGSALDNKLVLLKKQNM
jgi:arylesterase/paraoxonase